MFWPYLQMSARSDGGLAGLRDCSNLFRLNFSGYDVPISLVLNNSALGGGRAGTNVPPGFPNRITPTSYARRATSISATYAPGPPSPWPVGPPSGPPGPSGSLESDSDELSEDGLSAAWIDTDVAWAAGHSGLADKALPTKNDIRTNAYAVFFIGLTAPYTVG
jgi:hypothetical protein